MPKSNRRSSKAKKMSNPWIIHVANFRKQNPNMEYKEALQKATSTYTPVSPKPVKKTSKRSSKKRKSGKSKRK